MTFDDRLRGFYVQAQERWPGVLVAFQAYRNRVLRAMGTAESAPPPPAAAIERYPLDDIYLACALEDQAPRAVEFFHRENYDFIRAIARKFARNAEDAEDVAQEICSGICGRIPKYAGSGSLRGWIAHLAPNVTRDLYRSGAAKRELSLEEMTEGAPGDSGEATGEMPLLSDAGTAARKIREELDASPCEEMFRKTLAQALARLDPDEMELVNFRYMKGLKGREIAQIRGVQEYVISKQLKKALARLEKRILMTATTLFGFSASDVRDCLEATRG